MMVMEEGIVIEVKGDRVFVKPQQSDRCEGCSTVFCSTDDSGNLVIEAKDPIGVKVGQHFRLAIQEQSLCGIASFYRVFPSSVSWWAYGGVALSETGLI